MNLELKPKACKQCGRMFTPARPLQRVCGPICAGKVAKAKRAEEKAKRKAEIARDRAKREELKTIPDLIKEAQRAFNSYVRARDRLRPCICCGRPLTQDAVGGGYDAGHWRSTGSASHLRFNEDNVHAQRKVCNRHGAGRAVDYRLGLIERIGLARVEALENDNTPHKWTREELIAIRDKYRAKLKELLKSQ